MKILFIQCFRYTIK